MAKAKMTASKAKTTAGKSKTTANQAKTPASKAKTTAGKGKPTAGKAKTTAGKAKTTAGKAKTTASKGKTIASKAKNTLAKTKVKKAMLKPVVSQQASSKNIETTEPLNTADMDMTLTIDRRISGERRETESIEQDIKQDIEQNIEQDIEQDIEKTEPRKLERRAKVNRRRQIDPTTCERDYSIEEIEFMNALDEYKRTSGRMFPTCSEVLEVLRGLGYQKCSLDDPDEPDATDATDATGEPDSTDTDCEESSTITVEQETPESEIEPSFKSETEIFHLESIESISSHDW